MKAEELRIGNLVWNPIQGKPCKVNLAVLENVKNDARVDRLEKYRFQPIPLTEGWLLDFGFENKNTIEYPNYYKGFYKCMWRNGKTNICNNNGFIKDLKHVHELQNLYHALTGDELILKP